MDTRVKERLTGAIMLVAVVVLVVPALLSGPRAPTRAPEPASGVSREVVVALDQGRPAPAEDPDNPQPEPAPEAPAAGIKLAPSGLPADDTGASGLAESPAAAGDSRAAASAGGLATSAGEGTAAVSPATGMPAPADTRPAAEPAKAWAVQLGAFSTPEAAQALVARLRTKGYPAFILERRSGGSVLYRVRVGPEQDRGRADVMAERLKGEGYPSAAVAPHP